MTNPIAKEKLNNETILIGYDLNDDYAQISYLVIGEVEPKTVSCVAGTEQYNIPVVLTKRKGVGQWYYGKEALKYAGEDGIPVYNLVSRAISGEEVMIEDRAYDPVALLTLFVKRTLTLLSMQVSLKGTEAFLFTMENLNARTIEVLERVAAGLSLECSNMLFQGHTESFFYYVLNQPPELWRSDVMVYEYHRNMKAMQFHCNRNTTPNVVLIENKEFPNMQRVKWPKNSVSPTDEEGIEDPEVTTLRQNLDLQFCKVIGDTVGNQTIGTIYLLGDGFKEEWSKESLRILCKDRRVFQGNNLYSKGACYCLAERMHPTEYSKNYVYLGEDKLKSNIGMKVLRRGEESYYAILDAGVNWYECKADFDVILKDGDSLNFLITPLTGARAYERAVPIEGLPERPERTTRLHLHLEMSSVSELDIEITDLGFGAIFPSSGRAFTKSIEV